MFGSKHTALKTIATCECGWEFRNPQLVAVPGYSAKVEHCTRCGLVLLVFKTESEPAPKTTFVKAVPITGKNEESISAALRIAPGITDEDIEFMLASTRTG